jgi:hypothetical protein
VIDLAPDLQIVVGSSALHAHGSPLHLVPGKTVFVSIDRRGIHHPGVASPWRLDTGGVARRSHPTVVVVEVGPRSPALTPATVPVLAASDGGAW